MCFGTLGGRFLGNHGNIIGKRRVFMLCVSRTNISENLGSKTLKMKKKFFRCKFEIENCKFCGKFV